uniref:Transmembrane protein n=4 Tax=Globisporangium ultimum TaxID=2052682 RepID=K3W838_GLOUD
MDVADANAAPRALTAAEKRAARRARVLQGGENRLKLVTGQISTLKEGDSAKSALNKEMDDALNELLGATEDSSAKSSTTNAKEGCSETEASDGATGGVPADPRFALRPDPAQRRRDAALRRQKKEAVVQELLAPLTATTQSKAGITNAEAPSPAAAAKETTNVVPKSSTAKAPATFSRHAFALRLHALEEKAILLVIFAAAVYLAMTIDLQSISTDIDAKDQILLSYQELLAQGLPLDSIRQQMEREHLEGFVVERIERLLSAQFSEAQPNVSFTNKFLPNVWDLPEYFSSLVYRPPVIVCVLLVRLLLTLFANGVHLAFQLPDVKNPQEDDLGFIANLALSSKPALKGYLIKFRKSFDDVFFFLYVLLFTVALRAIWVASFA